MLEAAGTDIASIQANGWSLDEFMEVIKNGTKDNTFGFIVANTGVIASAFLNIFGKGDERGNLSCLHLPPKANTPEEF